MRLAVVLVALAVAAVLLPGLARSPALDPRESRDLVVARELIEAHEALTPVLAGEPQFEKPLVAYAPDVAATLASRRPLETSRGWRIAVAALIVLLTGSLGARHLGPRAGVAAAAVLATSLALPLAARVDGAQLLGTLFAWVALDGFSDVLFGRRARTDAGGSAARVRPEPPRDARLVVSYVALAAAAVCCGPLPAMWPLLAIQLYVALARPRDGWKPLRVGLGLVVVAGLAFPWYAAMLERHGAAFLAHAPFYPYGLEPHRRWYLAPFLAVSMLVAGFFPWSALLPGALSHAAAWWRRPRPGGRPSPAPIARELSEERAAHWFIACWVSALAPILGYSAPPLTAVLPALPAAALLCGRLLDHVAEDARRVAELVQRSAQMLSLLGTVAALMLVLLASRLADLAPSLDALAGALFVTSWLPFLAGLLRRPRLSAALMMTPVLVGAPIVGLRVLPAAENYVSAARTGQALARVAPPRAAVVVFDDPPASLRLAVGRNLVRVEWLAGDLRRAAASDGYVYLAFRPSRERDVARAAPDSVRVLLRAPSLIAARVRA